MAQRKIVWSHRAQIQLFDILNFFAKRNKSKHYSIRLHNEIKKKLKLLQKYPELGMKTDLASIRGLISGNYIVFYEITDKEIIVHLLWDCRQDPDSRKIK